MLFMRISLRFALLALLNVAWASAQTGAGKAATTLPSTPNIVFILADDLGYGEVCCNNPKSLIATPNMDKLAAQGRRFTEAHSPASVCSPTRYGLLRGRYAWRTAMKGGVFDAVVAGTDDGHGGAVSSSRSQIKNTGYLGERADCGYLPPRSSAVSSSMFESLRLSDKLR